jgi:hypothetical protein
LEEANRDAKELQRGYLEQEAAVGGGLADHQQLLTAKNALGIILFAGFVTLLVVLVVTNLVAAAAADLPVIPFFESPPEFLTGTPGASFKNIKPYNRVPLQLTGGQSGRNSCSSV